MKTLGRVLELELNLEEALAILTGKGRQRRFFFARVCRIDKHLIGLYRPFHRGVAGFDSGYKEVHMAM